MHTQPDIIYLLVWHLNHYKWMDVPGIGLFKAQEQAAYIDHQNNTIYPPVLKAQMADSSVYNPDEMLNRMVAYTGYDKSELNRQLNALSFKLKEELREKGESYFIPFGKLSMVDGQIQYKSNGQNLHQQFYGMQGERLDPLPSAKPASEPAPIYIQPETRESPKSTYSEFKYIFWLLGLLWIIFMCLLFCPSKKKTPEPIQNPVVQEEDSLNAEDSLLSIILADTSYGSLPLQDTNSSLPIQEETTQQDTATPNADLQNETPIVPENVEELDKVVRNKTCIIIIGSFQKIANANRLAKKVQKGGYTLYRGRYKDFTRIGVRFDCMNRKLQDVLAELKEKYEPTAWILKY